MKRSIATLLIPVVIAFTAITDGQAKESTPRKPLWEIGLVGGGLSIPQYPGSDERFMLPFVLPYVIYRGKILRVDRSGLRGRLFDSNRLSLDLDFSFGLPVRNGNRARQGMPPLHLTGEVGPRLNYIVAKSRASSLSLHLPVRFAMDTSRTYLGWVCQPGLRYERDDLLASPGKLMLRLEGGLLYASQHYNQYYYGVDAPYVTASRPAYQAHQGLHSYYLYSSMRYRIDDAHSVGLMVRMQMLAPGVNADSPLVRSKYALSVGLGYIWRLWTSQENAPR